MQKARQKTQAERRRESEQSLLLATIDVIAEHGVSAATFEALGRSSGFSRGLATQHFGSKQNLIDTLLKHLSARQDALNRERGLDDKPGLEAVKAYVDRCLQDVVSHKYARVYFMLLSSSVADANDMRKDFQTVHADVASMLRRWIEKGQAAGSIRADLDASAAAVTVGCLLFGFAMQLLVNPSMELMSMRKACIAILHGSLAAQPAAKTPAGMQRPRSTRRTKAA